MVDLKLIILLITPILRIHSFETVVATLKIDPLDGLLRFYNKLSNICEPCDLLVNLEFCKAQFLVWCAGDCLLCLVLCCCEMLLQNRSVRDVCVAVLAHF